MSVDAYFLRIAGCIQNLLKDVFRRRPLHLRVSLRPITGAVVILRPSRNYPCSFRGETI